MSENIQLVQGSDAPRVLEIFSAARRQLWERHGIPCRFESVDWWVANLLLPAGGVYGYFRSGELIAFMVLERAPAGGVEIAHLYVDPAHQGNGIGAALLGFAKESGEGGLWLVCFEDNRRARCFYEAHGFIAREFRSGAANEENCADIVYCWGIS